MNNCTVYITKSKAREIIFQLRPEKNYTKQKLESLYKEKISHILSLPEKSLLQVFKEFYNEEEFSLSGYKKIDFKSKRNDIYVFGGNKVPSYHYDKKCTALTSTFDNYKIPEEIRNLGADEVARFKDFFIKNISLLREKPDVFNVKLKSTFTLNGQVEHVFSENSGIYEIENINLEDLEANIDRLLLDAENFRLKDTATQKLIYDKGYGTDRELKKKLSYPDKEYQILVEWHEKYKGQLKDLLEEYFRVKLNPELKFKNNLLDQLGFKPCKICTPVDIDEVLSNI